MPVDLLQSGGGSGGTALTGTGIARNTGACTELSGDVSTSGSNVTAVKTDLVLPGNPTTTTQTPANNSTRVATTAYVDTGLGTKQATLTGTGLARNTGASTELSGDVTTSGSNAATLKNTGTAGTYTKVTTDAQGRVTSGTTLGYADLPTTGGGVVTFIEDFISNPGSTITVSGLSGSRWDQSLSYAPITSGTTGTIASNNSTATFINPGIIVITTPATSGNGVVISSTTSSNSSGTQTLGALGNSAPWQADFWVLLPATITNYCVRVGIVQIVSQLDAPVNGMWVEYDTANVNSNSKWTLRTISASTSTYAITTVTPVANTWYHIIVSSSVAGTISAQVAASNGALSNAVTSNTNVPSNSVYGLGIQLLPRTTAAVTLTVDRMTYSATTGRA